MDSSTTASLTNTQPTEHISYPKRILHSKRSFHRTGSIDSPAYDASEEDNDPTTDDGTSSVVSIPISHQKSRAVSSHSNPLRVQNKKHQQVMDDEDPGVDSPTYDGDVESYTTAGPQHTSQRESTASLRDAHSSSESTVSTMTSPSSRPTSLHPDSSHRPPTSSPLTRSQTTPIPPKPSSEESFDAAKITPEEIQEWVRDIIASHSEGAPASRSYTINPPPIDRPVVIYADGVYDLFHYGHALQLRQAKLSFPSTRLLVGVCSDELVRKYKANSIMNHQERCESVRHCKWADEVIPEAPWIITPGFLEKYKIDYVAHDEGPYAAAGHNDVYGPVKRQGRFLPTRRTPGISTTDLVSRMVSQYRSGDFNSKLRKAGNEELSWNGL
ncbi:hypothetical protein BDM02DRAFT_1762149 [Thelephora ganbajun]|uniref:Uncharacterized protein n=1 Tax=Thelephora ganbajun TaxID=370292 RepID=A0ACB6ZJU8_THEGA|nr:hypothetical protein BDM02DRAFT_1762149 [Thelephora ganbajun]